MNKIYIIAAMVIILLWSGLGHSKIVSFMGVCTALWLPISLKVYQFLLNWLPLVEGHRSYLPKEDQQQPLERFAASLIAAGGTIFLLILFPPDRAFIDSIALNIIVLLFLFNIKENWQPRSVIFLLLLGGLLSSTTLGQMRTTIYVTCFAWAFAWVALIGLSFFYRQNYLSMRDILLFTACASWCGMRGFCIFVPLTFVLLWLFSTINFQFIPRDPSYQINRVGITVWNFLTPSACLIALATTIFVKSFLTI